MQKVNNVYQFAINNLILNTASTSSGIIVAKIPEETAPSSAITFFTSHISSGKTYPCLVRIRENASVEVVPLNWNGDGVDSALYMSFSATWIG